MAIAAVPITSRNRRWSLIPLLFAAAMLPVLAANAALVYFALHSMPPLVSDHPFEDGRTYNREIAAAEAQERLGWKVALEVPQRAFVSSPVGFEAADQNGVPITGLAVELRAWRPVGAAPDLRTRLLEERPGQYRAQLTLPLAGQWQFDLIARRGPEEYVLGRRIIVK